MPMPPSHATPAPPATNQAPPPAYANSPSTPPQKIAEVDILFLGSPGSGKSTFLSRLPQVASGPITSATPLPASRIDLESRPFTFSVSLFRRPYTFRLWPSTGTLFIDVFPDTPHFVVITYDISSRASLWNAQYYWRRQVAAHYSDLEHTMPVMLLGLKRDLRTDELDEEGKFVCVMPQEGLKTATEMRCDRYAECSAVTGELLWEAVEDITRVAAKTTTKNGGLSEGNACSLM